MQDSRAAALAELLEQAPGDAPGVLLSVVAPLEGLNWQGAAGAADLACAEPLSTAHGFRIASMSKTFTGLIASQLAEEGRLDLQAPVAELLPPDVRLEFTRAVGQGAAAINTERLLLHRAGFSDFALSAAWFDELSKDPGRFRAPPEIAIWALKHGEIIDAPGQRYHYSDTGYVLAGLVLEQVSGRPYWQLCRERIFDRLGMEETWLEGHEAPRCDLSHCYLHTQGDHIDALQINGSCDWAAGGHVSTLADLDLFLQGLFNGELFRRRSTLDEMLVGAPAKPGFYYGRGVGRKQLAGSHLWGHLGHWGSFMYFCPERRLRIAGTLNVDTDLQNPFLESVLRALAG